MSPFAEVASDVLLKLPSDPAAARMARQALRQARLPDDLQHTVDLLSTEIIANAVRHGDMKPGEEITFAATFVEDFIHVEVHDPGPSFDVARAQQGKGFGLRMVDKLASRWGVECEHGVRVWFEVDRRTRRFPRRTS